MTVTPASSPKPPRSQKARLMSCQSKGEHMEDFPACEAKDPKDDTAKPVIRDAKYDEDATDAGVSDDLRETTVPRTFDAIYEFDTVAEDSEAAALPDRPVALSGSGFSCSCSGSTKDGTSRDDGFLAAGVIPIRSGIGNAEPDHASQLLCVLHNTGLLADLGLSELHFCSEAAEDLKNLGVASEERGTTLSAACCPRRISAQALKQTTEAEHPCARRLTAALRRPRRR